MKYFNIETEISRTIKKYKLFSKTDKIAVALSGGKDSVTVLYILKKLGYDVRALTIDLGLGEWSLINIRNMKKFCSNLDIKLNIVDFEDEVGEPLKLLWEKNKNLTKCSVCGIIRKRILNKSAKKLKVDKIVTGHNLDDECQTVLMNFLKGNIYLGINSTPKTGIFQKAFVQRVKPLFFIPESEIKKYAEKMNFPVLYKKCPFGSDSYRIQLRDWLKNVSLSNKLRIVKNFQEIIQNLRKEYQGNIKMCRFCNEASSGEICKYCKILKSFSDE